MASILKKNARAIDIALRLADLCVLGAAFPLAYFLRDGVLGDKFAGLYANDRYWPVLLLTQLLWIGAAAVCDLYAAYRTRSMWLELNRLTRSALLVALGLGAFQFFSRQHDVSRLLIGLYFAAALALLVLVRFALRLVARSVRSHGYNTRRFAVAGSGALARQIVGGIRVRPEWGYTFAGYLLENHPADGAVPLPVLGQIRDLRRILEGEVIDEIIIAVASAKNELTKEILQVCEERGIPVKLCMDFPLNGISKVSFEDLEGVPTVAFSPVPSDVIALGAKRAFDILVSMVALILLAPLFLLIAVAIRLESQGPVFFFQRRAGMNGRTFVLWKFRSMCIDAEARLAMLRSRNEVGGPVFKMTDDPRVTQVGRFIRKTSLDELPQFWNVLCGDMSVVGPRPPLPAEVVKYEPWQRRRLSVKPGITCIWQVSGRSDIEFDQWMKLDLAYIDTWSLWSDVKIVAKTVPAVLFGRGAH
jgi:exopolysaccharide biosynthesis polyprenyl glycosylphosphotransferase